MEEKLHIDKSILHDFKIGIKLGHGSSGSVFKGFHVRSGEVVALKQISLRGINPSDLPNIMSEINLLRNLDHPNILHYLGYIKTVESLHIILEYCTNGSLRRLLKTQGPLPELKVAKYISEVLQALVYLHQEGVIHRDIKASNILIDQTGKTKLGDFGIAIRIETLNSDSTIGSPYWMAPEVVECSRISTASDIWSLGALTVELFTSEPPYHFLEPLPALFRIVNDASPPIPRNLSPAGQSFLQECFVKDPNHRVSATVLTGNGWFYKVQQGQILNDSGVILKPRKETESDGPHSAAVNFGTLQLSEDSNSVEDYSDLLSVPDDFDFVGKIATLKISKKPILHPQDLHYAYASCEADLQALNIGSSVSQQNLQIDIGAVASCLIERNPEVAKEDYSDSFEKGIV